MIIRCVALTALLFLCAQVVRAADAVTTHQVQALGVQVKRAEDRFETGESISRAEMSALERHLSMARVELLAQNNVRIGGKLQSIVIQFAKLRNEWARHAASLRQARVALAQSDAEIPTVQHGGSCATALGIGVHHSVKLTLPASSSVWFVVSGLMTSSTVLRTWSSGPDPAFDAFRSCSPHARILASNDDSFGLDAQVTLPTDSPQPMYVRLTNTGGAGKILVDAAAASGSVNGTVKDGATGLGLAGVDLTLLTPDGHFGGEITSNADGTYSIPVSYAGSYYLITQAGGYVAQVYPAVNCQLSILGNDLSKCDLTHATKLDVTTTGTISNINFSLSKGLTISGQIRDSNNRPLSNAQISFVNYFDQQNLVLAGTDAVGHYSISTLGPGNFPLVATANGYGSQLYDHVACDGPLLNQCDATKATPVSLVSQNVYDIDFNLPQLAYVSGHVSTREGVPIAYTQILLVDSNNLNIAYADTDNSGGFTIGSLILGQTYYLEATAGGFFSQLYDGVDCSASCAANLPDATPIVASFTGQQLVADFAMDTLPVVRGHVKDSVTGLPLSGVAVGLSMTPPASTYYSQYTAYTDADGDYSVGNVPAGTYYVWAQSADHIDQVYSGVPCESYGQFPGTPCDVSGATLVTIASDSAPGPIDFSLLKAGSLSGKVTIQAGAGSDLGASVNLAVYDGSSTLVANVFSDEQGNYVVNDLPTGNYYVVELGYGTYPYGSYVPQLWHGLPCLNNCVPTTGTPIAVTQGNDTGSIDFSVIRIDGIVGRIVDDIGSPLPNVIVDLFTTTDKSYYGGTYTDAAGSYVISTPIGTSYYVATEAGGGYLDQVYSGIPCPNGSAYDQKCALNGATAISINQNPAQSHIVNFVLKSTDRLFANGFE